MTDNPTPPPPPRDTRADLILIALAFINSAALADARADALRSDAKLAALLEAGNATKLSSLLIRILAQEGVFTHNQQGDFVDARGKVISQEELNAILERRMADMKTLLANLNAELEAGKMSVDEWESAVSVEIRRANLQAYALGRGGWAAIERSEMKLLSARIRDEIGFLLIFAGAIRTGTQSGAQINARANLYANHLRSIFYTGLTAGKQRAGLTEERRFLGKAEHCDDCIGYAGQGWVPIGTLPSPGDGSVCQSNCQCTIEYR